MSISPILSSALPTEVPTSKDSPEKIRDAASQFESLLIGQVLKTVHESSSGGWLGTDGDEASNAAMGLGDEYLARTISQHGGFGLAKMISAGLQKTKAD